MAQTILVSMVGPKGHKGKGKKKEVDPNVDDFPIGAHGGSLQTRPTNKAYNLNIGFLQYWALLDENNSDSFI
jgi:hypothetical protein